MHLSQTDFSLLYPNISSLFLKMTVNPQRAIDLNINASLEFLKLVMPTRISAMNRGDNEGLLGVDTISELPLDHKPKSKWTGKRLRIPHELTNRMTPSLKRKANRASGKDAEDEIWMHVGSTRKESLANGFEDGTQDGHTEGADI